MTITVTDFPVREPIADLSQGGLVTERWRVWLRNLNGTVQAQPTKTTTPVTLDDKAATIAITPIPSGALAAGLYRISWDAYVKTPDGAASSVTITVSWTLNSHVESFTGAAMTGDTTSTSQSYSQLIRVDADSPVSYAILYASTTPGKMIYRADFVLETISV